MIQRVMKVKNLANYFWETIHLLDVSSDKRQLMIGGNLVWAELAAITEPTAAELEVSEIQLRCINLKLMQQLRPSIGPLDESAANDHSLFTIDSNGTLSFRASPDFENPQSTNDSNIYSVTLIATDVTDSANPTEFATRTVSITVTDVDDTSPLIQDQLTTVPENTSGAFYTFASNETVSWTISGVDAGLFDINSSTGELSFKADGLPDYENPTDSYDSTVDTNPATNDEVANNRYTINVRATDASGNFATVFTIVVSDVEEVAPTISVHQLLH